MEVTQTDRRSKTILLLLTIFLLAIGLRMVMPIYLLKQQKSDWTMFMSYSSPPQIWSYAVKIAEGHSTGERREWSFYYVPYAFIASLPIRLTNWTGLAQYSVLFVQMMQAVVDAFGCFLVYWVLSVNSRRAVALAGALLYALWPASIFYSYHILCESCTPILSLLTGCAFMVATLRGSWASYTMAGLAAGLLILIRPDNIVVVPVFAAFTIWARHRSVAMAIGRVAILLVVFLVSYIVASQAIFRTVNLQRVESTAGLGLYNALGEYPATFRGLRIYGDGPALEHAAKQVDYYLEKQDPIFMLMLSVYDSNPKVLAYVREVVVGKPVLYFDWILRRFVAYLPSHPYVAYISYYLSRVMQKPDGYVSMVGYRFSQIFHGVKFVDYFLFCLFAWGVWVCRRDQPMLAFICVYFGVLIGHVLTQVGEVYFRLDAEESFTNPAYLLGMVSIWPVFIPVGGAALLETIRRHRGVSAPA